MADLAARATCSLFVCQSSHEMLQYLTHMLRAAARAPLYPRSLDHGRGESNSKQYLIYFSNEFQVAVPWMYCSFGGYETLVFRRDELIDSSEEILEDEGIRSQYSDDLREVWEAEE